MLYGTETNPAEENNLLLKTNVSEKSVVQMKRTQSMTDENSPVNEVASARFDSVKNFRDVKNVASKFSSIFAYLPVAWTLKILACS